jgi:hypothetical protein
MKRGVGTDEQLVAPVERAVHDGDVGAARADEAIDFRLRVRGRARRAAEAEGEDNDERAEHDRILARTAVHLCHLLEMRIFRLALVVSAALGAVGCFQSTTLITVKADGSGTIEQSMVMTGQALAQLRTLAALGGKDAKPPDIFGEEQARKAAAAIGTGVTVVSSTPIHTADGEGATYVLAFEDINALHIDQSPPARGGVRSDAPPAEPAPQIRFALTPQPDGNALLRVTFPPFKMPDAAKLAGIRPPQSRSRPTPEQMAMIRQMFAGAHIGIAIEPVGTLVKTSSPYVDGAKVTLLDVDLDRLLSDSTATSRMNEAKTMEDVKAAIKDVPGLKVHVDPEITIEFTPAR